uniref:Uncharacterized protein n=1 Tax=Nonomuraea gerenzanensis TaxID=93944 RepID=A0A1M4E7Y6_9ACTN|nr:hypothetical protein BN4615_P4408 [Nonomuraea gerenzanensis]
MPQAPKQRAERFAQPSPSRSPCAKPGISVTCHEMPQVKLSGPDRCSSPRRRLPAVRAARSPSP